MSVSVFVFFNISKRFFLHLALDLPQVFNFSALCLAVKALTCFGFFHHAGPQCSSAALLLIFCTSISAMRLLSCGDLHTFVYYDSPLVYFSVLKFFTIFLLNYRKLLTVDVLITYKLSEILPHTLSPLGLLYLAVDFWRTVHSQNLLYHFKSLGCY